MGTADHFEKRYFGADADTLTALMNEESDYWNMGGGDDTFTSDLQTGYETYEDLWGQDMVDMKGGNDLVISRDGGETIKLGNEGAGGIGTGDTVQDKKGVSTVRIYPTHEKDHVYGQKDETTRGQCVIIKDMWEVTNIELVLDDPWHPESQYGDDDDYCSLLLHGWELQWYFGATATPAWKTSMSSKMHVWFSRSTGEASFCVGDSDT